ncbi:MAG: triose-phosphate isomerase [Candidatus Pacebacteria bacterium]|nr:triose-phosphate isomerase [Candidatus Paceibacterota bacterium]
MTKQKIIVANWKMNPENIDGAKAILNSIRKEIKSKEGIEIIICPPSIYIEGLKKELIKQENLKLKLGGQNCFWEEKGAFTGEISPTMLRGMGCQYVILGHSERRKILEETDEIISKKLKTALKIGLKVVLCIGETEEDRKENLTFDVLRAQIENTIGLLSGRHTTNIIIAYEPVWAIGTGKNCKSDEAMSILMYIKKELLKILSQNTVDRISFLYGGSVNGKNARNYIEGGFEGLLVGGASLKPGEFIKIIDSLKEKHDKEYFRK